MKLKDIDYKKGNKRLTHTNMKPGYFIKWRNPDSGLEGFYVYFDNGEHLTQKGICGFDPDSEEEGWKFEELE